MRYICESEKETKSKALALKNASCFICSLGICPYAEPYLTDGEDGLTCEECPYCVEISRNEI